MNNIVSAAWEEPAIVGTGSLKKVTQWGDNGISMVTSPVSGGWSWGW